MALQPPNDRIPPEAPFPAVTGGSGLRLRLWIGCLGGALLAAAGIWWVIGTQTRPDGALDLPVLVTWLAAVAGAGIVIGAAAALWLDRGIVSHLRGLNDGIAAGQVSRLRGLPASAGWGELSELTQRAQHLISHHRQMARAADELGLTRGQITRLRESLERWNESERWSELWTEGGPLAPVTESLNQGLRRLDEIREQNLEVVHQIEHEVARALEEARESSEQAERGFVEATSLLTTVRELQRLEGELTRTLAVARGAQAAHDEIVRVLADARGAIHDMAAISNADLDHLGRDVRTVGEIVEQVRRIGQRATVIALQAAVAGVEGGADPELGGELRRLSGEVEAAVERADSLGRAMQAEAADTSRRHDEEHARIAERVQRLALLSLPADQPNDEALRLLERMREMIQDASRKSERLSAAGERASRAAERLVRVIDEETSELAGLAARLSHPAPDAAVAPPDAPEAPAETGERGLKLFGQEHRLPEDSTPPKAREDRP